MCGIWGLVAPGEMDPGTIRSITDNLFVLSESRGKEAAGIAGLSSDGIIVHKMAQPASALIRSKEYDDLVGQCTGSDNKAVALIGHSRLVTNGSEMSNSNNQPVCCDGLAVVHNGIIVNVDEIWADQKELCRETELDTEVFARLSGSYRREGDVVTATQRAYNDIQGTASTLTLFGNESKLVCATNNGSLYFWRSRDHRIMILASERFILTELSKMNSFVRREFEPDRIVHLNAGRGVEIDAIGSTAKRFKLDPYRMVRYVNRKPDKEFSVLSAKYKGFEIDTDPIRKLRRCTRCVLPETMPFIEFDENGVCNYCRSYKKMEYKGRDALDNWALGIKSQNARKEYNSVVSFSGGRDSSYGLHYFVKELGLKPVAYNYDWGMVTDLARRNQARMCAALGVELITISADIRTKRDNIRKNILAWMKKPDLGMIPLFMAGDKAYFYYANVIKKRFGLDGILLASNPFEITYFKSGFCGIRPKVLNNVGSDENIEKQSTGGIFKTGGYYGKQYLGNTGYINSSLIDTLLASFSFYLIPHDYFRLYDYIPWNENVIDDVLINEYDWETAPDTDSTWRIGDGTAPFYNYIYYSVCGFTENDTLRSNQIREGVLDREKALELVYRDNQPRWESLDWYFDTVKLEATDVLEVVRKMPKLYPV